jgi:hypothetical protein
MISHLRSAGCGLAAAGLIAASLVPAPAHAASTTATLTVRAQVIEGCETRLPDLLPPQARRHLPEQVRDLVVHDCRRPVEPQIDARWSAWPPSRHRQVSIGRQPGRGGILVTISY